MPRLSFQLQILSSVFLVNTEFELGVGLFKFRLLDIKAALQVSHLGLKLACGSLYKCKVQVKQIVYAILQVPSILQAIIFGTWGLMRIALDRTVRIFLYQRAGSIILAKPPLGDHMVRRKFLLFNVVLVVPKSTT